MRLEKYLQIGKILIKIKNRQMKLLKKTSNKILFGLITFGLTLILISMIVIRIMG